MEIEKLQGEGVRMVEEASEEIMLLWSVGQPCTAPQNAFVQHNSPLLQIDACGHNVSILQSPSSMNRAGVTGGVVWDSGVVLGKWLEHASDSHLFTIRGKKCVELGSGCGLVGCVAALLGAQVILTDLPDRLRLLERNIEENVRKVNAVVASDVVYNEEAVHDLIATLQSLCGSHTTVFVAGELRNDVVLEYFLESALKNFIIWCIEPTMWHPNYRSRRVAIFMMVKKF